MYNSVFVSGLGSDANDGSRGSPCRTWASAITKVNGGGAIIALDPADYGPVTIDRSVLLDGGFSYGGVGVDITINAEDDDQIVLRNLSIFGALAGVNANAAGVLFNSGESLFVERCSFVNDYEATIGATSIWFAPTKASKLRVSDCYVSGYPGVHVLPAAGGSAVAFLERVISKNGAIRFDNSYNAGAGSILATCKDCVATGSPNSGFTIKSGAAPVTLSLQGCVACDNAADGVHAIKGVGAATVFVGRSLLAGNAGLAANALSGAQVVSFGDNQLCANGTDGAFTSTRALS